MIIFLRGCDHQGQNRRMRRWRRQSGRWPPVKWKVVEWEVELWRQNRRDVGGGVRNFKTVFVLSWL